MSLRVLEVLFDRRGREGRRWHPLRQLERELGQVPRSMEQVVEVMVGEVVVRRGGVMTEEVKQRYDRDGDGSTDFE